MQRTVQRAGVILLVSAILLAGLYLSIWYYTQQLPASAPLTVGKLVGTRRPDFRLASQTGAFFTPADFSGKALLLNFWATWCTPCLQEIPMLVELQGEYGSKGFQVVGIALDEVQSVQKFVIEYGITYPILVGEVDVLETSAAYGNVTGVLPYSVLVDRDGIIRRQYRGEIQRLEVFNHLRELL